MAKKRKPATKAARRATRRGKQATTEVEAEGETSTAESAPSENVENTTTAEPALEAPAGPSDCYSNQSCVPPPSINKSSPLPVVALHKKFGKYRCLFNNDEAIQKKTELGSDSETNSSLEVKVVDPCASSESDSNVALDTHSDTNSAIGCTSPSLISQQDLPRGLSPAPAFSSSVGVKPLEGKRDISSASKIDDKVLVQSQNLQALNDNLDYKSQEGNNAVAPMMENHEIYHCDEDDEEVMTVIQIVEDDHQELYYNLNIDSSKSSPVDHHSHVSDQPHGETSFQEHFEKLHLTTDRAIAPMDTSCPLHLQSEPPFSKDHLLDIIPRPDPSLTPSSTLSDDSNSSRMAEHSLNHSNDSSESSPTGVRRSSRIKTISSLKQKTKGYGLVKTPLKKALITQTKLKLEELGSDSNEKLCEHIPAPNSPSFPVPSDMPVKVKSRWRRSSELEMGANSPANSPLASPNLPRLPAIVECPNTCEEEKETAPLSKEAYDKIIQERMDQFEHLEENEYLCDRMVSRDTKKMICDCFLTKEEIDRGELACGEDCLNRLLMIECNSRCPVGDRCTNRRFQKRENAMLKVFYADKKGCGVEANVDIPPGEFLMEYVGEVLDYEQFYKRAQTYSDENNLHHYFMSLKGDTVIDATLKGNISRFINHSCDPNAETQKWTVNGELRIGFFSKRDIKANEELTFDYQFQRFGKVAQRCYCGTDNCRGWIGAEPDSEDEYEEEEEDVSTSKSSATETSLESLTMDAEVQIQPRRVKRRERKYKPAPELVQDADIDEDLEALSRTGVKNQSHTLRLSRTVVRAKTRRAQIALLRLLRDADLPCRRLFLDYRGLRLLAPWCSDASLDFRLEMLQTVDRLPITNKTMVLESRFFTIVERWLSSTDVTLDSVFIDESTGLPVDIANRTGQDDHILPDKNKDVAAIQDKVKDLCSQLLERWSSLKEAYKIPKKERIQQMKEHERQANVERRAADSSGSRDRDRDRDHRDREREREREREKEKERDRYRERERERERDDRDRRKRRGSPENRRSIRLSDRVLAAVPPMSKEERRRAFAEAAAKADDSRRQRERNCQYWPEFAQTQMFPNGMMVPGNFPPGVVMDMRPEDFPPYCAPFPQPYCVPNMMGGMNLNYPMNNMGGFVFPPQLPFPPQTQSQPPTQSQAQGPQPPSDGQKEVLLPSMWRSAVDARGRTYYYHVKVRRPQWNPPELPVVSDDEEESDEEEELEHPVNIDAIIRRPKGKLVEGVNGIYEVIKEGPQNGLIPEHALVNVRPRKRRPGLVSERPISPRTEEDKLAGRLEVKRYKQTKEKLRKRKERLLQKVKLLAAARKRGKDMSQQEIKMIELVDSESDSEPDSESEQLDKPPSPLPVPEPPAPVVDQDEVARKIKEHFRSNMARVMVQHLNPFRHSEAKMGRITNTSDFKHLARKLTHFVMLKELKHCRSVDELVVTDSVRTKAKTFVKKYMAKFGPVYKRPVEEID